MKTFKTVLVGCGSISNAWLAPAVKHPNIRFVGLVDLDPAMARSQAEKFGLSPDLASTDLAACLRETGAELVFDCTTPPAHRQVVLAAVEAGCHVFGEKPLAETLADAKVMVRAAETAGVVYGVMQNRRWQPNGINRVKQALKEGIIGTPHSFHTDFFIGAHFGGFRDEMKHVLLLDMAIHSFDQIRYLSEAAPLNVWANDWNPPESWYSHGASAVAFFEHANGVRSSYRGSWCAEGKPTSWQCDWRIIGTRGSLLWDGEEGITVEKVTATEGFIREGEKIEVPHSSTGTPNNHEAAILDFIDSLLHARKPATPAGDNILSLAMVHAAIASAESGKTVSIPQLLEQENI